LFLNWKYALCLIIHHFANDVYARWGVADTALIAEAVCNKRRTAIFHSVFTFSLHHFESNRCHLWVPVLPSSHRMPSSFPYFIHCPDCLHQRWNWRYLSPEIFEKRCAFLAYPKFCRTKKQNFDVDLYGVCIFLASCCEI